MQGNWVLATAIYTITPGLGALKPGAVPHLWPLIFGVKILLFMKLENISKMY